SARYTLVYSYSGGGYRAANTYRQSAGLNCPWNYTASHPNDRERGTRPSARRAECCCVGPTRAVDVTEAHWRTTRITRGGETLNRNTVMPPRRRLSNADCRRCE